MRFKHLKDWLKIFKGSIQSNCQELKRMKIKVASRKKIIIQQNMMMNSCFKMKEIKIFTDQVKINTIVIIQYNIKLNYNYKIQ